VAAGPKAGKRATLASRVTSKPTPRTATTVVNATVNPSRRAPPARQASRSERSYAIKP
jgi:hypothetical protein